MAKKVDHFKKMNSSEVAIEKRLRKQLSLDKDVDILEDVIVSLKKEITALKEEIKTLKENPENKKKISLFKGEWPDIDNNIYGQVVQQAPRNNG